MVEDDGDLVLLLLRVDRGSFIPEACGAFVSVAIRSSFQPGGGVFGSLGNSFVGAVVLARNSRCSFDSGGMLRASAL